MKTILWIFIVLIGIGLVALPILSGCRVIDVDGNVIGYLSAVVTYLMAIVALLTLQQNSSLVLYQSQSSDYKQLMQAIGEMDASIMSEQKARGIDCTNMVNYKDARVHFYAAMSKLREKENRVYSCMTEDQAGVFSKLCEPYIDDIFDEMVCFESLIAMMEIVDQSEHELTEGDVIKLLLVPERQTPRYLELNELMKISLESGFDVFKKNIALFVGKLTQRDEKLGTNYAEGLRSVVSNAKDRVKQPSI